MTYRGIFVTGTNTEIGKTVVSRALVRAFVHRGLRVAAVKPIESGASWEGDRLVPLDAAALTRASGQDAEVAQNCVYCFADPVSPHLAAARVGEHIEPGPILDLLGHWQNQSDLVIAEGAGGLLVPLSDDLVLGDLIARTGFRLVIVAPNALGTINTTLLTVEAARKRGIDVAGVILNRTPPTELGNAAAIACHGRVPILGQFPDATIDSDDDLANTARQSIELDELLRTV